MRPEDTSVSFLVDDDVAGITSAPTNGLTSNLAVLAPSYKATWEPGQMHRTLPRRRSSSSASSKNRVSQDPGPSKTRRKSKDMVHHPLNGTSSGQRGGVTRPQLEKLISGLDAWNLDEGESVSDEVEEEPPAQLEEEKVVLVHQVLPKDSLPGVALKYGVTLAELRKANQLWSTDPIHLRKVLYIPIKSEQIPSYIDSITPPPTVRRIPASHMSFFPPPHARPLIELSTPPPSPQPKLKSLSRHVRSATSPAITITPRSSPTPRSLTQQHRHTPPPPLSRHGSALSSLFAAIPMPIAARLSIDSSRGESEEGMEHELDDVGHKTRRPHAPLAVRPRDGVVAGTMPPRSRGFVPGALPYRFPTPPPPAPPPPRTVQLEPSPAMQLPALNRKGKGRESIVDARVEETTLITFDEGVTSTHSGI